MSKPLLTLKILYRFKFVFNDKNQLALFYQPIMIVKLIVKLLNRQLNETLLKKLD